METITLTGGSLSQLKREIEGTVVETAQRQELQEAVRSLRSPIPQTST